MKTFLKKILTFMSISFAVIALIVVLPKYIIIENSNFELKENISKVIVGHSHPECAYNDSLITNFRNLSSSGESYFYTYQKITKVIKDNPKISKVLIEFSNNQINGIMDEWIWGYEKMSHFLPLYFPFIDMKDFNLLYSRNPKDFITCISISSKKNILQLFSFNFSYASKIGGFKWLDESITESELNKNVRGMKYKSVSEENLKYLRKIINHCKAKKLEVYLIRTPQHRKFHYLANENKFQEIRRNNFSDVDFLDFNLFPIPDEYFADYGHLNHKGAEIFSNSIERLMNNGLLDSSNKQEMINNHINNY